MSDTLEMNFIATFHQVVILGAVVFVEKRINLLAHLL